MAGLNLFRPSDISTGLQGYWKLDEASGNRSDSSGNGNTLTDNNTVASVAFDYWNSGENSADFERSNPTEYLSITHASQTGLDITGSWTVAAWVKLETVGITNTVAAKDSGAANGYNARINASNQMTLQNNNAGGTPTSTTTISAGKWYHLVWQYDDSNNLANFYINGNLDASVSYTQTPVTNTQYFALGYSYTDAFDGLMKDAAIWNTLLTPAQIKSLAFGIDITGTVYRPSNVSTQPVSWWKLNEISDGTAKTRVDSVGSNNLTDINTVVSAGGYIEGVGAYFKSSASERLVITDASQSGLDITGNLTISAWFKMKSAGLNQTICSKYLTPNRSFWLVVNSSNFMQWIVSSDGTSTTSVTGGTTLKVGTWYHVAAIHDADNDEIEIYIDGVSDSTPVAHTTGIFNGSADFIIGSMQEAARYWDGVIADVAIWNVVLSDADIASLASGLPLQQSGLVSYWKLDDDTTTTADSVGSNTLSENGTVTSVSGQVGTAHQFASVGDKWSITDNASLSITRDLSMLCWFKASNFTNGNRVLMGKGDTAYSLHLTTGGALRMTINSIEAGGTTATFTLNTAGHAAGVWGVASTGTEAASLYVDSIPQAFALNATPTDNADAFEIADGNTSFNDFGGTSNTTNFIDEVTVWTRWLRDEEIKAAYNKGLNGFETTAASVASSTGGFFAIF